MIVVAGPLDATARDRLPAHFHTLPGEDLRLRFGQSLSAERVAAYLGAIADERDAVFAVEDAQRLFVGVAHVAFGPDRAELGVSVLAAHRRLGIGSALFERAAAHARSQGVARLYMHCLVGNVPIMRMARRFRMSIVADAGDADAHLALPPWSPEGRRGTPASAACVAGS